MSYRVLTADPPWKFDDNLPGAHRGAAKNYPVMALADIESFSLPDIADDALLFLWRVASMPEEAYRVVRAWGFVPKTEIVWLKRRASGKRWFGMGHFVRAEHETCIVATRGKIKVLSRSIRSTFEAPVGLHSEKPEMFYREIVERLSPGPYVELFARRQREGWTCLGPEGSITAATLPCPAGRLEREAGLQPAMTASVR